MRSGDYLNYLNEKIRELDDKLKEATAARDSYLEFFNSSGSVVARNNSVSDTVEVDRKALRPKGRTRDVLEFFYRNPAGASLGDVAKKMRYTEREVSQMYHRFSHDGFLIPDTEGNKVIITEKGRALIEKSQPYGGNRF